MMLRKKLILRFLTVAVGSSISAVSLWAQPSEIPFHKEPYELSSGLHTGIGEETVSAFVQTVRIPDAPWLRLHFGDFNLGERSFIKMTSLKDGGWLRLDARTLPQWQNGGAGFNGDAVRMELHVAPGESGIFFQLEELTVGEWVGDPLGTLDGVETICGIDDRSGSTDNRVGRLLLASGGGCTAWLLPNGLLATAGHCVDLNPPDGVIDLFGVVEFNVPASNPNGTIKLALPNDRYVINNPGYIGYQNGGGGAPIDWGVFTVAPNPNTGLLPYQAYGGFLRISDGIPIAPLTIRITGCGVDSTAAGTGGTFNAQNQTLQTSTGPYEDFDNSTHEYKVDTEGANSGSPIILVQSNVSLGIHTQGGCIFLGLGANKGTAFTNATLVGSIDNFLGTNVQYVDIGHPLSSDLGETGSLIRPWNTVAEGVNAVGVGGLVAIVQGSYPGAITISKAVTINGLMGIVTIGQ